MLICHVINSLNRGGAETHLFDLITEQIKNNDVVKIVAIGPDSKNIIVKCNYWLEREEHL